MATTNAGSLSVLVEADTASFDSSMSKAAAVAEREMKRVEKAQAQAKAEGERFTTMLQRQVDTFGMSGTKIYEYEARLKGVSKEAQPLIDKLNELKAAQNAAGEGENIKKSAHAMEGLSFHTTAAKRELLVLAHELSQGNYKKFGGSIMVLGEQTGAAGLLFSGMGLAALAAAAGVGLFATAAIKGSMESEALRKSLALTNNFAGQTEGSFNALAASISGKTGISIGHTREALDALVATGEIGPRVLGPLTQAVTLYAKATGETEEKVAAEFAKMGDGVAKFAAEHNKQMNFLSGDQYAYIKRLEEQGKAEEAQLEVSRLLNDHLANTLRPNLGLLEKAWKAITSTAAESWDAMKGIGREETVEDKIAKQIQRLENIRKAASAQPALGSSGLKKFDSGAAEELALQELRALGMQKVAKEQKALDDSEKGRMEKMRVAAIDSRDKWREELKGITQVERELEKYRRLTVEPLKGTENAISPGEQAKAEAEIRRKFQSHAESEAASEAKKMATAIKDRLQLYADESAKLRDQTDQYEKLGKVVDKSAYAIAKIDTTSGKFAKASIDKKNQILAQALALDAIAEKEHRAADAAKEHTKETNRLATAKTELAKHLGENQIYVDGEIERLQESTKMLGLNTVEQRVFNAELMIRKRLQKELADPHNVGLDMTQAKDDAARQTKEWTDAIRKSDAEQKTFGFGANKVFKQYGEDAANAAKFAESFLGGSMKRVEDALIGFVKTGKLSFSDLFSFMAEEYLRQMIRMQMASMLPGGSGGFSFGSILGGIGGLFGGGASGSAGGSLIDAGVTGLTALAATGINSVPYDGMPAILHKGEAVVPAAYNPASNGAIGSGTGSVSVGSGQVINIGQGVSRAEVTSAINAANKASEARIQRGLRQGTFG